MNKATQEDTNAGSADSANKFTKKVGQYIQENPIKVLSAAALCWGSLLLLLFFLRIGYMPDINFESITSVLYAVALLGLMISVYTMLVMVMPGLFLSGAKDATDRVTGGHLLCITAGSAIIWAVMICRMFDVSICSYSLTDTSVWIVGTLVALLAPGIGLWISRKWPSKSSESENNGSKAPQKWTPQENAIAIYLWSLAMLIGVGSLLGISLMFISILGMGGSIRTATGGQAVLQIAMLVFLIACSSALIGSVKKSERQKLTWIFAPTLLFVVLSTTGSFSTIPMIAVKTLGLGEISAARIAVTGKTCREVNQTLGQHVCVNVGDDEVTAICPVMIKSRIGGQVVLDFAALADILDQDKKPHIYWVTTEGAIDGKQGQRITRRVILDKAKLVGWQPLLGIGERDLSEMKMDTTSMRVSTWLDVKNVNQGGTGVSTESSLDTFLINRCGEKISS